MQIYLDLILITRMTKIINTVFKGNIPLKTGNKSYYSGNIS
jgi:hypothetical protein